MSDTLSIKKDKEDLVEIKVELADCQQPCLFIGGRVYFDGMHYRIMPAEADTVREAMRRGVYQTAQEEGKNTNSLRKKQEQRLGGR